MNPAPINVFSYTNQLVRLTVPEYFYPLSGKVRESPLSPPLGTVRETFALTRLKPYFKRDLTWVLCTC
ncbi:MAG: hypothetical protein ACBR12_27220, partial [Microcoleus sp.]